MAVVLRGKDAVEWVYRGEGAVNLVLAYRGNSSKFVGKVLRIQKVATNGAEYDTNHLSLTAHECLIWQEFEGIVSAPTREIAEQIYVQNVMTPLLGSDHVDAGIRIVVTKDFLEAVEKKVLCQRPSWRVDAAKVNSVCDSALLISDHSIFPRVSGVLSEDFNVSIEIKPKAGFLPCSEYIDEENAVKRRITRFRMHQVLKIKEGKLSQLSKYDPLDMFSGSKDRVRNAVMALFLTPQNNFRVFLNGSLIFGGMDEASSEGFAVHQEFQDGLRHVISAKNGMQTQHFLELVSETLFRSSALSRLLEVQKLDVFDIEGAIHAYYDVVSQPCAVCLEKCRNNSCSSIHSLPFGKKIKIVRDYLISATAKDLSLMISFRARDSLNSEFLYGSVFLEPTNQTFDYKASFIDLDMKPLKKMEYYYELDQKIVKCYMQIAKEESLNSCSANCA